MMLLLRISGRHLGLAIGTNVQAWDTQLDSLAGLSYSGNSLKVVRVNAGETAFERGHLRWWWTVTATGGSLTANSVVLGAGTTDTKVVAGIVTDGSRRISLGVQTSLVGQLEFFNATSGSIVLQPETGALSTGVITIPTEPSGIMATRGWVATANTTGSAGSLSISGQTGLLSVTGLTSTNRIKTVRDAADTILELGGSYTPTGTWTSLTMVTPVLGTPTSGTLTNCTGLPAGGHSFTATDKLLGRSTAGSGVGEEITCTAAGRALIDDAAASDQRTTLGLTALATTTPGTGVATFLATPSSANLLAALTDETGTGAAVFANTPTLVTPVLGTPNSGTLTSCTGLVSFVAANEATDSPPVSHCS